MNRPVTLQAAFRFFLPLIFMTELNMISKSVIHAFVARLPQPKLALAGLNVAFFFYFTLTSSTETANLLSISYLRDRRSFRHLFGFFCVVLAAPVGLALLIALTPFGAWLYGLLFGGSAEVIRQAQQATLVLSFSAPVLMLRALAFAMIMLRQRTILITCSTFLRLLSLGLSLLVLPRLLEGAAVGAAALVICMAVESLFAYGMSRKYFRDLPEPEGPPPSYWEMWRFSWPVMLNQATESGLAVLINIFLGRLANPDLALAAFGVVHGLVSLILSPLRNLVQTAQTLVRSREDVRVMLRFSSYLALFFLLLVFALFLSPARGFILDRVMGLTAELSAYSTPAVKLAGSITLFWACAALFRGLLAGHRKTGTFAASALARMATVVVLGSLTFFVTGMNGAVFGVVAWAGAFVVETLILGWRLFLPMGRTPPLYSLRGESTGEEN
ncbi:MAG: hypothetical protein O7A69_13120 [SAR324 cluster bacterium]|nr:hypothetical protein [SAR324 cluster bacterium]